MLVGPYGLLWTYCSCPYAAYIICAILWTPVLTPKVIMYTVGPSGYKYPLCTSSTLSLYSLTNTLCLLHSQHLQVGCISLISCTLMAVQQSVPWERIKCYATRAKN